MLIPLAVVKGNVRSSDGWNFGGDFMASTSVNPEFRPMTRLDHEAVFPVK
jgi:hypothetical protein